MRDFQIYIDDDRYSVPTLHIASLASEARALEIAERYMRESDHHLGVEVREDDKVVFSLGSFAPVTRRDHLEGDHA